MAEGNTAQPVTDEQYLQPEQEAMDLNLQSKRSAKPTWKVKENLEGRKHELSSNILNLWQKLQSYMSAISQPACEVSSLEEALAQLGAVYELYTLKSQEYVTILKKLNTQNSLEELQSFDHLNIDRASLIHEVKSNTSARIAQLLETTSHISVSTRSSKRSSKSRSLKYSTLSMQIVNARAEAEAAKIQAAFAQKKAEMEIKAASEKAEMEMKAARRAASEKAEMEALEKQCEHATAMARLKVLEQAASEGDRDSISLSEVDAEDPLKRTRNYVLSQNSEPLIAANVPDGAHIYPEQKDSKPYTVHHIQGQYNAQPLCHPDPFPLTMVHHSPAPQQTQYTNTQLQANIPANHQISDSHIVHQVAGPIDFKPVPGLNAYAAPYLSMSLTNNTTNNMCSTTQPAIPCLKSEKTDMSDFAKYMVRRELTKTVLTRFDDQPENYRGWKCSFRSAISDLGITATEELDLLIRWLGPQSTERVKRLRSVHIFNPAAGLSAAWERLEQSFGSPEAIENALFKRLQDFPKISGKDNEKFQELSDLLSELQLAKADNHLPGLSYLDTAHGVNPIVSKLPYGIQEKWTTLGSRYKRENRVAFPPFSYFCEFVRNIAESKNDPSFSYSESSHHGLPPPKYDSPRSNYKSTRGPVSVKKTEILQTPTSVPDNNNQREKIENPNRLCPIHKKPHPLKKCIGFRKKPLHERKELLKKFGVCFRCCASTEHFAKDCKTDIKCIECGCEDHVQALHPSQPYPVSPTHFLPGPKHGGENAGQATNPAIVSSSCTEVCGEDICDKSCAKICLVNVYPKGQPEKFLRVYTILDDQSNRSLARSELFDLLNLKGDAYPYTLGTCSGITEVSGRRASGLVLTSLNDDIEIPLPTLVECNQIPSNKEEIPTPEAAFHHPHLRAISSEIPSLDKNAEILLLLGRDILRVHKVRQQINGPNDAPFAQRLDLGWVIVGNVCIDKMKKPTKISSFKTNILLNGRSTCFQPCPHHYWVKEQLISSKTQYDLQDNTNPVRTWDDSLGSTVFNSTSEDNKLAPAREDIEFLKVMDKDFTQDDSNSWVAPLPFRSPRVKLQNNLQQAVARFSSLKRTLKRKPEMEKHFVDFMQNIFDRDHAEPAPPLKEGEECWYLPSFGVYHPRKPNQIRVVFDSSAQYDGVSLNNLLLTGPNLNNSLIGVLIRFRQEPVAVVADIQQMFHCFIVKEDNRNYLRFLWHKDNDVNSEVIDYRMKVHVFGNSPSPAVAIYGLRRTAKEGEKDYGSDARHFVERNFYVDDGLKSLPTSEEAIDLLTRTQEMLSVANLRLHKIISNSQKVLEAFPSDDHAINLKDLDLGSDIPPIQRSLGLLWKYLPFKSVCEKPFTKRGVLSVVNSIYDPLGFIAPVTIHGKMLLRQFTTESLDWDTPLPTDKQQRWETWKKSLKILEQLQIPRCYIPSSLSAAIKREIHVFSDASIEAIAAVAYLRVFGTNNKPHCGFVLGKAKLTPKPAHSVPRLELCAAVLAVEIAEAIKDEMDVAIDSFTFYTDSKVVLGYIHNQTKQFYVYVSNRVERIRSFSTPEQWHHIDTDLNPADRGTRPSPASGLCDMWLSPPTFLYSDLCSLSTNTNYNLIDPESDKEIRPTNSTLYTTVTTKLKLKSHRFDRFSTWSSLVRAVARLIHIAQCFSKETSPGCHGWHICKKHPTVADLEHAEEMLIRCVQQEVYDQEIDSITKGIHLSKNSILFKLNPLLDQHKLLRVGGRIARSDLCIKEHNPVIIPGRHYIATLLIRHHHVRVQHQGRQFTEGAIRSAGLWIIGMKRCISSVLHRCVKCNKLRGRHQQQLMADLPADRLSTDPPFTYVGLDVFGPWSVITRRTRGGAANSKRWAVLFTCLSIRAVHIEVIESMDTSCFINSLRRFFSIRGPAKQLRSDCGTNFVGACKELQLDNFLLTNGCTWEFNPPHSSHMGGSWERMIGIARRILDAMLLDHKSSLTHEVLVTFLAEVSAIINARPLVPVSSDPDSASILTPATLLTQKIGTAPIPPEILNHSNIYRRQWKQVQHLSNVFWHRWKTEYLHLLQRRHKWQVSKPNLQTGDLVLLKDKEAHCNEWPMGLITKVVPSDDGKTRKVEVKVTKGGSTRVFFRPITELVLLLPKEDIT